MRAKPGRPALTWAAALTVVFALGSGGEAAAQLTPDNTFDGNGLKVDEAARVVEETSATNGNREGQCPRRHRLGHPRDRQRRRGPHGEHGATNEVTDVIPNPGTMTFTFPANTTGSAVTHEVTGTIPLRTIHDPDAEDQTVVLATAFANLRTVGASWAGGSMVTTYSTSADCTHVLDGLGRGSVAAMPMVKAKRKGRVRLPAGARRLAPASAEGSPAGGTQARLATPLPAGWLEAPALAAAARGPLALYISTLPRTVAPEDDSLFLMAGVAPRHSPPTGPTPSPMNL